MDQPEATWKCRPIANKKAPAAAEAFVNVVIRSIKRSRINQPRTAYWRMISASEKIIAPGLAVASCRGCKERRLYTRWSHR